MDFRTADLLDANEDLAVLDTVLLHFGQRLRFAGPVTTLRVFEDNALVRRALEEPGLGRVLVVDGGASRRTALVGGRLATLARDNGWAGIVVNGCIRDSAEISTIDVGIRALGAQPRKSERFATGERDVVVEFGGVAFRPGHFVYVDEDGVVLSDRQL